MIAVTDEAILRLAKKVARDSKAKKAELAEALHLLADLMERRQRIYERGRRLTDLIEDIQRDP